MLTSRKACWQTSIIRISHVCAGIRTPLAIGKVHEIMASHPKHTPSPICLRTIWCHASRIQGLQGTTHRRNDSIIAPKCQAFSHKRCTSTTRHHFCWGNVQRKLQMAPCALAALLQKPLTPSLCLTSLTRQCVDRWCKHRQSPWNPKQQRLHVFHTGLRLLAAGNSGITSWPSNPKRLMQPMQQGFALQAHLRATKRQKYAKM